MSITGDLQAQMARLDAELREVNEKIATLEATLRGKNHNLLKKLSDEEDKEVSSRVVAVAKWKRAEHSAEAIAWLAKQAAQIKEHGSVVWAGQETAPCGHCGASCATTRYCVCLNTGTEFWAPCCAMPHNNSPMEKAEVAGRFRCRCCGIECVRVPKGYSPAKEE